MKKELSEDIVWNPDEFYDNDGIEICPHNKVLKIKVKTTYRAVNSFMYEVWKDDERGYYKVTVQPSLYASTEDRSTWFADDWTIIGMDNIVKYEGK